MRSSCQIPELIDELKPVLELFAKRVGGELHVDSAPAVPAVLADRVRIQQVLVALVQNACDASALCPGVPKICVATSSDRYMVEIGVQDSGPGVPDGHSAPVVSSLFYDQGTRDGPRSGLEQGDS